MDINMDSIRAKFDAWFMGMGYPLELKGDMWIAYWQGYMDAPQYPEPALKDAP